jgi:hypothetical protein
VPKYRSRSVFFPRELLQSTEIRSTKKLNSTKNPKRNKKSIKESATLSSIELPKGRKIFCFHFPQPWKSAKDIRSFLFLRFSIAAGGTFTEKKKSQASLASELSPPKTQSYVTNQIFFRFV